MRILRYLILCTIILLNGYRSSGQIVGVGSDKDTVSAYSAKDTIYVFNQYPNAKPGQLMEQYHAGDTATFVWSKFDTLTYLFDIPEKTDHNQPNSVINSLAQGGYKVIVGTSNTPIDTFYARVYLNNPFTMKLNTDNYGNLLSFYRKCYYIDLTYSSTANHFTYDTPSDTLHNKITRRNHLSYVWSANPPLKVPMIV